MQQPYTFIFLFICCFQAIHADPLADNAPLAAITIINPALRTTLELALDVLAAKMGDIQELMIDLTISNESQFEVLESSIASISP